MLTPQEFGKQLRRARRAKKMRARDLYKITKINEDYIKDLEEGKLTFLPEPYIRAFLRTIANELDLSVEKVLQDYDDILHPKDLFWKEAQTKAEPPISPHSKPVVKKRKKPTEKEEKTPDAISSEGKESFPKTTNELRGHSAPSEKIDQTKKAIPKKIKSSPTPKSKTSNKTEMALIAAVVIIFLAVGFIYWKYGRQYFVEKKEPVKEITVFEAHDEIMKHEKQVENAQHSLQLTKKQELKSVPTRQKVTLHLVTLDTTWVRVIRDGKDTSEYIFRPGNSRDFEADSLLQLRMGRADGLKLWVNGDSLGILGSSAEVVRKLVIDRKGVREKKLWRPKRPVKN